MTSLFINRGLSTTSRWCAGAAAANPSVGSSVDSTANEAAKIIEDLLIMFDMRKIIWAWQNFAKVESIVWKGHLVARLGIPCD